MRIFAAILTAFYIAGCTSTWRAPVESRGSRPAAPKPPPAAPRGDQYRVQRGDTLYAIAWRTDIDYRLLASWNGIRPPYRIYAGQTLRLTPPAAVRVPPPAPSTAGVKPRPVPPPPAAPTRSPAATPATPKATPSDASMPKRLVWRWPVEGRVVSTFAPGDSLRQGIKISGRSGDPIYATEAGRVVYSGSGLIGYGRLIIVKHNDNYLSAYGHNRELLVKEGDQVTKGQKIAEMGNANHGEPLLHFEIRRDGKPVDPLRLLPRR